MKKLLIVLGVLAAIIIGAYLYLKFRKTEDFEPLIKAKLQQAVKDGSNGLYTLDIDKIDIDILKSTAFIHNAKLSVDSARLKTLIAQNIAPTDVYKISVSDLGIDGINISDVIQKKNIDLDVLSIKNPTVEIFHPVGKNKQVSKDTSTLYARMAKSLGHFYLKNFSISNMNFIYHNIEQKEKLTAFTNVSMKFKDIEIDSATQFDTTRFLYAKDAVIYLNNYSFRTADSLYFIKADSLTLHAAKGDLNVTGLKLEPRGNKQEFSSKLKFYKDRYDIKFTKAGFKRVDWYHLFLGESFTSSTASFENGTMEVYADRRVSASGKSKVGNYPQQMLMKLDLPADIDSINIKNFKFTYTEFNPKSGKAGSIIFDDIDGLITNVTNVKEKIATNKYLKITAHSKLMSKGNFTAAFTFDLTKTKNGDFTVDANLGAMDGTALNTATMPLGLFEINNLDVKSLKLHVYGSNYKGGGNVLFVYDDLKITALKPGDNGGKLKQRGLISFVANNFILNKSNSTKKGIATLQRDPQRSFFWLIWKSILGGLTETVK